MKLSLRKSVRLGAFAIAALLTSFAPVSAGDGSWKDQGPMVSPNWGGLYIAGSVGWGFGKADETLEHTLFATAHEKVDIDGFTGTVAVGYDFMVSPNFLFGVFGDYTFGELEGSGDRFSPPASTVAFDVSVDNRWAIGARIGFVRSEYSLWYLTAGYTQADLTYSDVGGSVERDLKGYFLGAGFEKMLRTGWFLRAEYRFTDFGKETVFQGTSVGGGCAPTCTERERIDTNIHDFRLGLVYKLGAEPVAAHESYK